MVCPAHALAELLSVAVLTARATFVAVMFAQLK
jgi:hypothetical protein